ncbi:MAG TPA: aldo/keto reductase [Microthrixaceae bacterium]|nr:aldo/keto reductase [Microthrixaceae bacterium]HPB44286.1 aldo/keto reductase [Microthrixaceae bacterium]
MDARTDSTAEDDAVELSALGLSTSRIYELDVSAAAELLNAAVESGCTVIDCADVWGFDPAALADPSQRPGFGSAEERIGEVLATSPGLRDELFITTKGGAFPPIPLECSADYLVQACDASLYRLGVEQIDLYQIHQPDLLTHPAEVASALDSLVAAGKVAQVGVCQHNPSQVDTLQAFLDVQIASVAMPFNLLALGALIDGRLDQAVTLGLVPFATQPLCGGRVFGELTGKTAAAVEVCRRIADEQGVELAAVLLAFAMHHPSTMVPLVSTISVDHLRQAAAAEDVGLSRQQWYEIYQAARGSQILHGMP